MIAGWAAYALAAVLAADLASDEGDPRDGGGGEASPGEVSFRRGVSAYDHGDYVGAISWFRKAYAQHPEPVILFDIAQAQRALGRCQDGLTTIDAYLAKAGSEDSLISRARDLRELLLSCAPEPRPAEQPLVVAPNPPPSVPAPPPPSTSGAPMILREPVGHPGSSARYKSSPLATACTTAVGATIALGVTDVVLALLARSYASRVDEATVWTQEVDAADERRRTLGTAATTMAVATGIGAAVAGTACWLNWRRTESR
jgi:hypothetical protein